MIKSPIPALVIALSFAARALADPCGMVPPISVDPARSDIARVGLQKTYAFYKDGVETFVIRPGFTGKVEEFGMLIPFPTPPAIRKVADDVFPHLAAAVDPPEVLVDLRWSNNGGMGLGGGGFAGMSMQSKEPSLSIAKDQVRVLREEAVGMYEVVVLEAGSAAALKRWMDDHQFRYPAGMDKVCADYVRLGWCFVAVRTRLGHKSQVDPQPGQTAIDFGLQPGASFDGHVQAMGFRFRTKTFVLPMRLATFNEGELHNVVYLLTEKPNRVDRIVTDFVVRQLPGTQLFRNVTGLLPLRVIGGTVRDIPRSQRRGLDAQRDPAGHNGIARELFASDLVCATSDRLSITHEETEKELLKIGEMLRLRGPALDRLHHTALDTERQAETAGALKRLAGMTLTVVDGHFSREVLATDNLTFSPFSMAPNKNTARTYDARRFGPAPRQPGSVTWDKLTSLESATPTSIAIQEHADQRPWLWGGCVVVGLATMLLGRRRPVAMLSLILLAAVFGVSMLIGTASAQESLPSTAKVLRILVRVEEGQSIDLVVPELRRLGVPAVAALADVVVHGKSHLTRRGWAVVLLTQIGGEGATQILRDLQRDRSLPPLVLQWVNAGVIQLCNSPRDLLQQVSGGVLDESLHRPFEIRLAELAESASELPAAADLLRFTALNPSWNARLASWLRKTDPAAFVDAMFTDADTTVRRQAAAVLALRASEGDKSAIVERIGDRLRFRGDVDVPWRGGPLFLPSAGWSRDEARQFVRPLLAWWLWCETRNKQGDCNIIRNNLSSLGNMAGLPQAKTLDDWLLSWGRAVGAGDVEQLFAEQSNDGKLSLRK